jgi:hypothetical protein
MPAWSREDLRKIAQVEELLVSPLCEDGRTYRKPTRIWSVAVDGALYVRAFHGRDSLWYKSAARQKAGRVTADGLSRDVHFEPAEESVNDRIDEAYRGKYGNSDYLDAMIAAHARAATLKVTPRS